MAGYSRQSVADIIANAVIKAAPVNAEYNAIRDAFAFAGGHKHDGSSTEGAYVPLIADTDALNKVVIDTANNRIGVFVEVSAAAVEQIRIQDGAILPVTDNDIDLGASGTKFKNLYVNGIASIGSITLSGGTIDGTVIGGTTPAAADFTTMDASGNATVGGTFGVTGNTTIGGTLGVTGVTTLGTANITSADVNSGSIDGTTIGAVTPAAGTFTTLTANTSLTAATADINGGTLDGVTIGATSAAAATVTDLTASGTSTLTTVDINGGTIDGTTIGASSAAAGSFTTVSTSGQATLATADINGGTVDNTVIGATTPAAITGTTITGTSFVGPVTGNVTGNLTGNVTGNVTGDVTGNITSSGSSSFNNVTIDGTLNMNAGTTATITNLTSPTNTNDAATKGYVDTSISNLVDSAPGTLDTLNELAAALGDDPNFSTTITNSIATKLPLAGGTMTGAIAMSTNKITGLGDPTAAQDAVTKSYAEANFLDLTGGTMTGAIDMGSAKITSTYAPTNAADLTNKTYVDAILGSGQDATAAAAAAATSEANAATSETNAANSATAAASSATSAAASYDSFDDRYLGAKATAPTVDNDGDALINGALYFNTTTNIMNVYGSSGWQSAGSAVNGTSDRQTYTATSGQTVFAATYDAGYVDVYLNGVKLLAGTDFTATNGTSITLASGAAVNDIVDIVAYGTFVLADHLTETQSDAKYVEVAGDTMTGNLDVQGTVTADGLTVDGYADIELNGANLQIQTHTSGTGIIYDSITGYHTFKHNGTNVGQFRPSGDFQLYEDTGTTAKFFWDASAESLGIGTSSPDRALHVNTSQDYVAKFSSSDAGAAILLEDSNSTANYNRIGVITHDMQFVTNNSEAMRIDSSGNVGIGTSSPSAPLEVSASGASIVQITSGTNTSQSALYFADPDDTNAGYVLYDHTSNYMSFRTNGSGEDMRIDSSGNLLVGKTSIGLSTTGIDLRSTGLLQAIRNGGTVVELNRQTSDGTIIDFRKDNTTVGVIGVGSSGLTIGKGDTGFRFADGADAINPWNLSSNVARDGAISLGENGGRWKDLYLSGGVYLGGTGSANLLDDYEEGTWTPSLVFGGTNTGLTYDAGAGGTQGQYVKIGKLVYIAFSINLTNKGSSTGNAQISGAPFTSTNTYFNELGGFSHRYSSMSGINGPMTFLISSTGVITLYHPNSSAAASDNVAGVTSGNFNNNSRVWGNAVYMTNS